MCEFCENSKIVWDDCVAFGYSMHERRTVLSNGKVMVTKFTTIKPFECDFREKDFNINFCLICGRDLRQQIDETLIPPANVFEKLQQYCEKYGVKIEDRALNFDFVIELLEKVERKCLKE